MFSPCNMLRNIKNQQRISDLSLIDEKRLSKGSSTTNFRHVSIMDYPTKENLKNYGFSVQRLSLKFVIQIRNKKTKYLWKYTFINKSFSTLLPLIFKSWLTFWYDVRNYETVNSPCFGTDMQELPSDLSFLMFFFILNMTKAYLLK